MTLAISLQQANSEEYLAYLLPNAFYDGEIQEKYFNMIADYENK